MRFPKKLSGLLFISLSILFLADNCTRPPAIATLSPTQIPPTQIPTQTATESPAQAEGLALTPPMGWNSFNHFGCAIDETLVQETADAMVNSGMAAVGYQYINIDDCWMASTRDANDNLQGDPQKFPHGMKAVADYVHSKGLKLGLYLDRGVKTCSGYPGSYGFEVQDADQVASWGVDYIKDDNCSVVG